MHYVDSHETDQNASEEKNIVLRRCHSKRACHMQAHAEVVSLQTGTQWIMWAMFGSVPISKITHIELPDVIKSVIMTMSCWVVMIALVHQSLWLLPQMHICEFYMHLDKVAHIMHEQSDLFLHLAPSTLVLVSYLTTHDSRQHQHAY